jgi:hypothetical protein
VYTNYLVDTKQGKGGTTGVYTHTKYCVPENEPEDEFIITENAYGYITGAQGSDPISIF